MKSIWIKLLILCLLPIGLEVVTQMRITQPAIAQVTLEETLENTVENDIRLVVVRSLTRPGRLLPQVDKVTIEGNYALASWLQGEAGGMRALVKRDDVWELLPSIGGGLPRAEDLNRRTGMPLNIASSLLSRHMER